MTLPVPKAVADASLRAAVLAHITRYPGARRCDVEDDRAVAAILAHAPTVKQARTWVIEAFRVLKQTGAIEKRYQRVGWFVVAEERAA